MQIALSAFFILNKKIITYEKIIKGHGDANTYFALLIDYDKIMNKIPKGKSIRVVEIRNYKILRTNYII